MQRRIDNKHQIEALEEAGNIVELRIVKSSNGVPIDLDNEPVILFRGRDKLALPMLHYYRQLCKDDGCTDYQLESMDDMIRRFDEFALTSNAMKQPGCTLGK